MGEVKPGIYKHYKNKEYKVLYAAIDTETKEELVIYQAMYGDGKIWSRPKKMFLEKIEIDGVTKPRFEFISENDNDWQAKYMRALADYQNLQKRTMQEKMEFAKFANEQLLYELLPVYDNLKTSILHGSDENGNGWLDGVKYVVKQFKDALENSGIEEIKTEGEPFDHNTMEALQNEETTEEKNDGLVVKEVKAGYKLNGKVVIPARVIVYKKI